MAQVMDLPCADIFQVMIHESLITGNKVYESELGHGIAFGSKIIPDAITLTREYVRINTTDDLSRILMFDWWTQNSDRSLSDAGGNSNLLWKTDTGEVVMIDHDNAFDAGFQAKDFWTLHALRDQREAWKISERERVIKWMQDGLAQLDSLWQELPEEWFFDAFGDLRSKLDKETLRQLLSRPFTQPTNFWEIPNF